MSDQPIHIPVFQKELVHNTSLSTDQIVIDCTAGYGGHTGLLLQSLEHQNAHVMAFDRDSYACRYLTDKFKGPIDQGKLSIIHKPFSELRTHLEASGLFGQVDAIIADLGVSSPQLDQSERGFSFMSDGPLDMRMDQSITCDASFVVNTYSEAELSALFYEYGEEPKGRHLAHKIAQRRESKPFTRTSDLANFIKENIHYRKKSKTHPATRVFQALRIEVNKELDELKTLLIDGFEALRPGGRLGIITFHSLEDRLVKKAFKAYASSQIDIPRHLPLRQDQIEALSNIRGEIVKPFPIKASEEEIRHNSRARSAKLRIIKKMI